MVCVTCIILLLTCLPFVCWLLFNSIDGYNTYLNVLYIDEVDNGIVMQWSHCRFTRCGSDTGSLETPVFKEVSGELKMVTALH